MTLISLDRRILAHGVFPTRLKNRPFGFSATGKDLITKELNRFFRERHSVCREFTIDGASGKSAHVFRPWILNSNGSRVGEDPGYWVHSVFFDKLSQR